MDHGKHKLLPGLNVQWPWSQMLLSGEKVVETRRYPLPARYVGKELALIETPGPDGKENGVKQARVIGTVVFSGSFKYSSRSEWLRDKFRHLVARQDPKFAYKLGCETWGWVVQSVSALRKEAPPVKPYRGIVFTTPCAVPL